MRRTAASLPLALVLLDFTAVAVLLPDIRLDLGSSTLGGQWVLNAYLLALAALLPLFTRLRGRALAVAGALAMAAGAIVCARADSTGLLVTGRAVQGAGAAAVLACAAFDRRDGKLSALALPAVALALGPLVGGVLAEQNWWRVFFWAGLPLAAVAGAAALSAPPGERPGLPADTARLLARAAGLTAIAIGLVQADVWAWGWCVSLLVGGALLVRLGRLGAINGAPWAWGVLSGCVAALLFVLPQYFQLARNLSGVRSGTLVLVLTVPAVGAWLLSPWLARRVPAFALAVAGFACAGAGFGLLATIDAHSRYALLIGVLGLAGAGLGAAGRAVGRVPWLDGRLDPVVPALAGAALGLALVGGAFQSGQAAERGDGASFEQALASGAGSAAVILAALVVAAALSLGRPGRATTPASSAAPPAAGS